MKENYTKIEQTKTKEQKNLEFILTKSMDTLSIQPPLEIEENEIW